MIDEKNIEKTKILIKKSLSPKIVKAQNDVYNRIILEYGKFDIILDIESGNRKNSLRNIDSGLNHIVAKIAHKNKIGIGIDFEGLRHLNLHEKARRMERIRQNIKICRETKVKLGILGFKDKKDNSAFLLSMGASTQQIKEAIYF